MRKAVHKDALKGLVGCLLLALLIFILALIAMKLGSISISYQEIFSDESTGDLFFVFFTAESGGETL